MKWSCWNTGYQITDNFENNYLGLPAPVNQIGNHAKPSF